MDYAGAGGWIEVISGVMFSGKSEELLRRVRRAVIARRQVQVFKSHLDDRYAGVCSRHHARWRAPAVGAGPVARRSRSRAGAPAARHVVAIDEAQFLDDGHRRCRQRPRRPRRSRDRGRHRHGLPGRAVRPDTRAAGRSPSRWTSCTRSACAAGQLATRNQRLIDGQPGAAEGPTIQVGGLRVVRGEVPALPRSAGAGEVTAATAGLKRRADAWRGHALRARLAAAGRRERVPLFPGEFFERRMRWRSYDAVGSRDDSIGHAAGRACGAGWPYCTGPSNRRVGAPG